MNILFCSKGIVFLEMGGKLLLKICKSCTNVNRHLILNDGLYLSSLSYFSQDVLQFVNHLWVGFCYVVLLIEIVGDAVELRIRIVAGLNLRSHLIIFEPSFGSMYFHSLVRMESTWLFDISATHGRWVVSMPSRLPRWFLLSGHCP